MDDGEKLLLVLKLWLVLVPVIITVSNSKLVSSCDEMFEPDTSGFISIDCGATADYKDEATGLFYVSDKKCMDTGEIHEISPNFEAWTTHKQQRKKLRSFPQGTRNCYTLKLKQGESNKYLIRAISDYGNYDRRNERPVFDLYLGVNRWLTVSETPQFHEIIHVSSMEYLDIYLVNIKQGVPYVTALELRPLDNAIYIYRTRNGALRTMVRFDVGSRDHSRLLRYPDDDYDRIWFPLNFENSNVTYTEKTIYTQSIDEGYKVPQKVLQTAATPQNASSPLNLYVQRPSAYQFYFYFYFAEIEKPEGRKLKIDLNAEHYLSGSLDYLKATIIAQNDPPITSSVINFSISSAEGSNDPPILNAVEIYALLELPISPTNLDDVNAIKDIKSSYKVTRNWQGDPCAPSNLSWDGLLCSNDTTPRITSLNLSSSNLTGEITILFSKLGAITHLDLSYNGLKGPLPDFLAQLPNLKVLNLTGNKFTGSVPDGLIQKSKDGTLLLSLEENPGLCLSGSCHKQKKFIIPIVSSSIGVLLILFAFIILAQYRRKKKRAYNRPVPPKGTARPGIAAKSRVPPPCPGHPIENFQSSFTYEELKMATDNFSEANLLGQGGFGYVHKGVLPDGKLVAIKQLKTGSIQGEREFQAEVDIISRVHHRHLVSLVGYSMSEEHRLLVYEFVPNKTLEFHLHGKGRAVMSWPIRMKIALGSARGLAYLHEDCHPKIIHRDIKAANILIDDSFEAKVADFGLAKFSLDTDTHISTRVMGTFGYLAPEYASSGKLTEKSDTFSFGVLLLELITGRQPFYKNNSFPDDSIVDWAMPLLTQALEDGNFSTFVDPRLQEYDSSEVTRMVACAATCVRHSARRRPRMSQIVRALEGNIPLEDLNDGVAPGNSRAFGYGSSEYSSSPYKDDMKKCKKLALESGELGSSGFSMVTSDGGQNPSSSSTEGQQTTPEIEIQKAEKDTMSVVKALDNW